MWVHTHSKYSAKDALPDVADVVVRAAQLGYPAVGLTDHGNMAGSVQLYQACRRHGIEPMPGVEAYVTLDRTNYAGTRPITFHMGMLATTQRGYRNLVALHNASWRNFYYKPMLDMEDLARAAQDGLLDDVFGMSGCWYGLGPKMLREGDPRAVLNLLKALDGWFGAGFAIELQHHLIYDDEHDDGRHVQFLHALSESIGLPTVIGGDSHYVHRVDRPVHDMLKRLVSWSDDPEDATFPGELGYHMLSYDEARPLYPPHIWDKAMGCMDDLAERAAVVIPELEAFRMRVPDVTVTGDPWTEMVDVAEEAFTRTLGSIPKSRHGEYRARLDSEYEVVRAAGFAGYLMLARTICMELSRRDILWAPRGSASGSMLCWMLGITTFDPIKWSLRFDRFLSSDRTKPPDIDIDMDPERREEIFDWISSRFAALRVGTWAKYGIAEGSTNDDDEEGTGSLPKAYFRVKAKTVEARYGKDKSRWPQSARVFLGDPIPDAHWSLLKELDRLKPLQHYSTHAAGLVIASSPDELADLPIMMVAAKRHMVSAYDKNDVEAMGYVKFDLLNLTFLTALRIMQDVSGVRAGSVPLDDPKVFSMIAAGNVTGVFQLEGGATAAGVRRLRPRHIRDVIAAMALFRPATMDSGATDDFIARRNKEQAIPERHQIIASATKDTYGILLYQEQAIDVFRSLGMTIEEIEKARKAIKASNKDVGDAGAKLAEMMTRVHSLGFEAGMSGTDLSWLENALAAFAGYSFNRAHATSYGVWAYVSAWYRLHHPVAFWAGMLHAHGGDADDKVARYLQAARSDKVTIRPAHVNHSSASYTASRNRNSIFKGLKSIKGIGDAAATNIASNAPFTSLDDFALRTSSRAVTGSKNLGLGVAPEDCGGTVSLLHRAGALKGLDWKETE